MQKDPKKQKKENSKPSKDSRDRRVDINSGGTRPTIKPPEQKKLIRFRIGLLALLTLLTSTLLSFNFYYPSIQEWGNFESHLNVFLLININVLLLLFATLLILRNVIKLLYERRRRLLGFRLKIKLTLAFILVSSLPMILFFFVASGFLGSSLDFWFHGQFSDALNNTATLMTKIGEDQNEDLKHFVEIVSNDYLELPKKSRFRQSGAKHEEWMEKRLFRYRLDGLVWYDSSMMPLRSLFLKKEKEEVWFPLLKENVNQNISKFPQSFNHSLTNGQIYRAIYPIIIDSKLQFLEVSKIETGKQHFNLVEIRSKLKDYKTLLLLETPIRTNLTTYLLLFTLMIIFGGTWFGYYLARSIVEPIEILVGGTRRISRGDLDFQIDLKVDDEIGMLLDSFNAMTKELQHSRRKLAESQDELIEMNKVLEERNIFVELVVQNIQNGIFSLDNSGYVNWINPYMISIFQLKNKDCQKFIGKHYRSIFSKEQAAYFERLWTNLSMTEDNSVKTEAHLLMDKNTVHISMELFQLKTPQEKPMGRLLVVNDLTEIDRSTRARAWREVARRIAHEIKNPLTPIQLSAQRIRRKYLDKMEDGKLLDTCTSTIVNEVNGLKNMVNEFSKFARLPEVNPSPMNINQILADVCDLFRPGLPPSITIDLKTSSDIPKVLVDAEQMKRVLTNLIDNAIAAISDEGQIELISYYSTELKMLTINVIDNGCGVPEEMIHQIFDPYVTTKTDGTGLGLAIVQRIISDHGGFIRIENNKTGGTKVSIELPAHT